MKISYSWLKEYLKIDIDPKEVATILTDIGLEVEGAETFERVKGGLKGLVVGEVKSCARHPDADRLFITKVDVGSGEKLNIVCGAPNVREGQKVIVAKPGITLHKDNESYRIKETRIKGVVSEGMICAEDEIGMGTGHEGIMVLDDNAQPGMPVNKYFKIEKDTVFEIGLTPNRIDAASHYGVARDLAAFLSQNKEVRPELPDVGRFKTGNNSYKVDIKIENTDACRRYAGVTVTGVKIGPSPDWLQVRLASIGLKPINNIVDITNFVLNELGQPLHAFDADKLAGRKIIVRNMPEGTSFVTLDGVEHKLSAEDLMICDGREAVAIGGVFGGLYSGVTDETTNVFIESAYFNPLNIRRTVKRHGINTDSSFHFERGVDPDMTIVALKRAALLMKDLGGGTISSEVIDVYPKPIKPFTVVLDHSYMDRLTGKHIERSRIRKILNALEIDIIDEHKDQITVSVPPYRVDVSRQADVIEDILRIYGYNNIEFSESLNSSISHTTKPDRERMLDVASGYLSSNGFNEIMSNSLTKSAYYDNLSSYKPEFLVKLYNPLSSDLNVMRQTLLFGGLEAIAYNAHRKMHDLRFYESGNCYFYNAKKRESNPLGRYAEEQHVAIFITGNKYEPNWISREEKSSYFQLKSYVENIFERLGFNVDGFNIDYIKGKSDIFTEGLTYSQNNSTLAEFGIVTNKLARDFDIKEDVYYCDIFWDNVLKNLVTRDIEFLELPKYPEVRRDLALLLDRSVTFDRIRDLAFKTEKYFLKRINLFDVYTGDKIDKGKKSYAISFILQDRKKTLTDPQIDKIMNTLVSVFVNELNAEIR
jgi:phenylalanyl-tRNA synthetase beta chain